MDEVHAHELPGEGAGPLDDAVAEAAAGEVVYLTRDGEPVAAVVPPHTAAALERLVQADAVLAEIVARTGAPTLEHYRRVYESLGQPWPGDDVVRRLYPVGQ